VSGGVEDAQLVAHLPDEARRGILIAGFHLDAEELSCPDGLYLLKTGLVDEIPEDRLSLWVARTLLVRDYDTDREKTLAGRNL
jgi:hypothetical protein